jgi:hypothetical protein
MREVRDFLAVSLAALLCFGGAVADTGVQQLPNLEGVIPRVSRGLASASPSGFEPMDWGFENKGGEVKRVRWEVSSEMHNFHNSAVSFGSSYMSKVAPSGPGSAPANIKVLFPVSVLRDASGFSNRWAEVSVGASSLHRQHLGISSFGVHSGGLETSPVAFSSALRLDEATVQSAFLGAAGAHGHPVPIPNPMEKRFETTPSHSIRRLRGTIFDGLEKFPAESRAFFGLSGLWVEGGDWKRTSQGMRDAILEWVRAGGRLYLAETGTRDGEEGSREWGMGSVTRRAGWNEKEFTRLKEDVFNLDRSPFPALEADYSGWTSDLLKAHDLPLGWLALFLVAFSVLAAPVNLFVIAPSHRRHRLFITVPVFSLGAVLLLMGYIVGREGTGGKGIRNGLLYLEPGTASSILFQEQMSRTGIISQEAFPFPEDAVLMWVQSRAGRVPNLSLLRQGDEAAGGWFVSRAVQSHVLHRWIPSRASVVLSGDSGVQPILVSTVNHAMSPVFYVDESGECWKAAELLPGRPAVTEKSTREELESWYGKVFEEPSRNLKARAAHVAGRRGWFYAKAQQAPDFWLATSPKIEWVRNELLCVGPVKAQDIKGVAEVRP